jgi:RNA polymerase sigma factor (sigma-70 family)
MKRPGRNVSSDRGEELNAFQREMVELLPRLRRLARAIARGDADDLVQLTLERALARRHQWRPGTRLDSWMFRIMKNAWIDETRARRRQAQVLDAGADPEAVADDGEAALNLRLQAAEVEREMARLPDEQRLAIALVLVEGLSYKEAAEVLEVPMGTLTSRLVRGRTALLERLGAST